ncbi:3-hydroxyisobutyrate dehydrogenase [Psychrobacter lutiphocae]|uniref:3-hydroxyisobutyrate dehydrogenase n=1 Tax=Psychrobacter lutiphocae TaxID=540500 RepID=UPI00037EB658|nr:3-hydroxyisobutyrate dehydrogenase [Psychrobacter lutiphocae]
MLSKIINKHSTNSPLNLTFIGLGNMGGPMAINLVKAGFNVTVFDLSDTAQQQLAQAGAHTTTSPVEAVKEADVVITMLPAGKHVKSVYLGDANATALTEAGILSHIASTTLVIDSSTIAPADAKLVANVAAAKGIDIIDAPVSGGTAGAEAGTLTFIVGGKENAFQRALPILKIMGKNIFHAGDNGAGQVAKICNNMLLGILMTGTAEAINLGVKNGLDAAVLSEVMLQSSGCNWTLEVYNPYPGIQEKVPASRGYSGGFMTQHMHKDLHLALQTAEDSGAKVPMGTQATTLYDDHNEQYNDKDFSSIMGYFDDSVLKDV